MKPNSSPNRRQVMAGAAAATVTLVAPHVLGQAGKTPPSEKLNIAGIGVGGMGHNDIRSVSSENIVALCDVDKAHAAKSFKRFPKARIWTDFREMLDKQKDIDAVTIATPDHLHAVIAAAALKRGKHVFCQKPLTHSAGEARTLGELARKSKCATQMGNQGQASEGARLLAEFIADGAIGAVREVHAWSNRKRRISQRGVPRPGGSPPVPKTLNWDLWLGPAKERPYHPSYLPFRWRGWWDFGTGVLGDIGCHQLSAIFKALKLGHPSTIEACSSNDQVGPEIANETAPISSIVRYTFPAEGKRPPVKIIWYDGGMMPPRPEILEASRRMGGGDGNLYVGERGMMLGYRLIPEARMREYKRPPKTLPRSPGHYKEWLIACKGGPRAGSDFALHAAHLAEVVLLGNIAIRTRRKLAWDGPNMRFTNCDEANAYINPPYRKGWSM